MATAKKTTAAKKVTKTESKVDTKTTKAPATKAKVSPAKKETPKTSDTKVVKATSKVEPKKETKVVAKVSKSDEPEITLQFLYDEIMKIRAELGLLKALSKKNQEASGNERIEQELEEIKGKLFDLNERVEEMEVEYGYNDNY